MPCLSSSANSLPQNISTIAKAKAKAEADAVWDDIHAKVEGYYQHHVGVKELMTLLMPLYKQDDDT